MAVTYRDTGFSSQEELEKWMHIFMDGGPTISGSVSDSDDQAGSNITFIDVADGFDLSMYPGSILSGENVIY